MVGGKYLERAMEEVMPGMMDRIVRHVREELAED
jgi:glycerol-3-phosphate responsive antiterminator